MYTDSLLLDSDIYNSEYFMQNDVCRFCWKKNANQEISSHNYEKDSELGSRLMDRIIDCLDVNLTVEYPPYKICTACCEEINRFYNFKKFCQETDRRLRRTFQDKAKPGNIYIADLKYVKEEIHDASTNVEHENFEYFIELDNSEWSDTEKKQKEVKLKQKYRPKRTPTYCNICRIDFETEERFKSHNAPSHGIEDNFYKCFGCDKRFKNCKNRLAHEINFCKGLKDGYRCFICERCLPKRRMYEAHMRDHRDNVVKDLPEELFQCKRCCISFKTRDGLKEHSSKHHTVKKNYVCDSCGRVFTRQDYLHKHMLTHTGTKEHACPHCEFRSTQRSSLIVHIRKHTGERPYSCDICPQRCISSSNLRAHRRRHLGLKKFQCNICEKKFGYKVSLDEHIESSHQRSQTHACCHCGATYSHKRGLRRHLEAKHEKHKPEDDSALLVLKK